MAEPRIELRNLKLWDGKATLAGSGLRINTGVIEAVGAIEPLQPSIDAAGLWAMPGLIDAHVHLCLDPTRRTPPSATEVPDLNAMAERAEQMLRAGITTARDLGGGHGRELELRDAIERGKLAGPRLLCAGQPLTSVGGHCHFWGGEVASIAEAERHIDSQIARGVDLIKVMASGGVMTRESSPAAAQFEQAMLDAIVARSAHHEKGVAAHCHSTLSIERATTAGVATIEHCSWVNERGWGAGYDPTLAERMSERGIQISPTINSNWKRHLTAKDPNRRDQLRRIFADLEAKGVALIASTDAGIPGVPHDNLPNALPVFAELAALSKERVLQTATSAAAAALGLPLAGRLTTGAWADVLLIDGDPREDLSRLQSPVGIIARGRWVKPL
ncbi:MAG: amidohydrolase family protein [Pseudomonadota bacterium]